MYTQGNWQQTGSSVSVKNRGIIANVPGVKDGGVFDASDNLRLISAAPDLHSAANNALVTLEAINDLCNTTIAQETIKELKSALAKADGK